MTKLEEQLISFDNIEAAVKEVSHGKRYKDEFQEFYLNLEDNVINIQNELIWRSYEPLDTVSFPIREPRLRLITRPMIYDRVVHHALMRVIGPVIESHYHDCSFACRKGSEHITATAWVKGEPHSFTWTPRNKGLYTYPKALPFNKAKDYVREETNRLFDNSAYRIDVSLHEGRGQMAAVRRYQDLLRKGLGRYGDNLYIVCIDFKHFFQSIDHETLKAIIRYIFPDEDMIVWLCSKIIDASDNERSTCPAIPMSPTDLPDAGIPIGFLPSQSFSNLVGSCVDWQLDAEGYDLVVRYADDIRILCGSQEEGELILDRIDMYVNKLLKLHLSEKKSYVKKFKEYDTYCGYRVHPHYLECKPETLKRAHRRLERKKKEYAEGWISLKQLEDTAYPLLAYRSWTDSPRDEKAEEILNYAKSIKRTNSNSKEKEAKLEL